MPDTDTSPDAVLEHQIQDLLASLGATWERSSSETANAGPAVEFSIKVRLGLDLKLRLIMIGDQLEIVFNDCYMVLEESAHVPKLGRNPNSRDDWRNECLAIVRQIVSRDLRIETRWRWGRPLGGYLYTWNGTDWEFSGGGGSILSPFGERKVSVYRNWLAPA